MFFHIKLRYAAAKEDILHRSPWSFNYKSFSLLDFNPLCCLEDYDFSCLEIWVRVYEVPLGLMTKAMAMSLGGSLGKILVVDMRVLRGCSKPKLCLVCYERLPMFCFGYGLLGHQAFSSRTVKVGALTKLQYGERMRLPPQKNLLESVQYGIRKGFGSLQYVGEALEKWQRDHWCNTQSRIKALHDSINNSLQKRLSNSEAQEFIRNKIELKTLLDNERFIGFGDRGWRGYPMEIIMHLTSMLGRMGEKKNRIHGLYDVQGIWRIGKHDIMRISVDYLRFIGFGDRGWRGYPMEIIMHLTSMLGRMGEKKNRIHGLYDVQGIWRIGEMDMGLVNKTILVLIPKKDEQIKEALRIYEILSGQKVNHEKYVLYFSPKTALPQYMMSFDLLPECLVKDMTSAIRHYWWFENVDKRRWLLVAWKTLCKPKWDFIRLFKLCVGVYSGELALGVVLGFIVINGGTKVILDVTITSCHRDVINWGYHDSGIYPRTQEIMRLAEILTSVALSIVIDPSTWMEDSLSILGQYKYDCQGGGTMSKGRAVPNIGSTMDCDGWRPPVTGVIKVNTDGVFDCDRRVAILGVIARDLSDQVYVGLAQMTVGCFEAGFAKLHALLADLSLAYDKGREDVQFEIDSLILVHKITQTSDDISTLGVFVLEVHVIFQSRLRFHITFAPRAGNAIAHKWTLRSGGFVGCYTLEDKKWISRQDPYVCLEYRRKNPTFQEKFVFTLIEGLRELNVVVWNRNNISADDLIGSGRVQLHKVLSQGYDDCTWPLQSKYGRQSGEVRVILHCSNAKSTQPQKGKKKSISEYASSAPISQVSPYGYPPAAPSAPYPTTPYVTPPQYKSSYPTAIATYPTTRNGSYPPQTYPPHPQASTIYPPARTGIYPPPPY
ncbi:hypothetical protein F3Y22_tig00110210pilonHSYRG00151 [Hibiscus syriacus]|uniref:C2 domain-containing protein n=1 Tax=Hibiscus syriacus TaxID=106335 RepID=A0A6A3BBL2_HIBSY|nr:hypothetical protein F3Y22_tig00110210pilonHSYRG00151 [Hibiscus syriacus]